MKLTLEEALKNQFPETKFSFREALGVYRVIHIIWTGDLTRDTVLKFVKPFERVFISRKYINEASDSYENSKKYDIILLHCNNQ